MPARDAQSPSGRSKTIMPTTAEKLAAAREPLARIGITLVVNTGVVTRGDAWCDAVEKHGERIAHIYIEDGEWRRGEPWQQDLFRDRAWHPLRMLRVSYPWANVKFGAVVARILLACGLNVQWNGSGESAIQIRLDGGAA
jgi:hypothetical protein